MGLDTFNASLVRHVLNPSDLPELVADIRRAGALGVPVVFDFETTDVNEALPWSRVSCMALTFPFDNDKTYVVGLSHPDAPMHVQWRRVLTGIAREISTHNVPVMNQNIRFDVRWMTAMTGINLVDNIVNETMLESHLADDMSSTSLKERVCSIFGIENWADFDFGAIGKKQWSEYEKTGVLPAALISEAVPYFELALYAARDTYWTLQLHRYYESLLSLTEEAQQAVSFDEPEQLELARIGLYYQRVGLPAVRTITDMEQNGFMLDREWCEQRLAENLDTIAERGAILSTYYTPAEQVKSMEPTSKYFLEWSDALVDSGDLRVLAMTDAGRPSWDQYVLAKLARQGYPAARDLLEYRKAGTENKFLKAWLESTGADGRIHATYHFARVRTGRLSCSGPNMQQVSRKMKSAFVAPPGKLLVASDYSQVELRVAAHIAHCEPMVDAFLEGKDLHRLMAAIVNGISYDEVTKEQRQEAKAANFGFLFGMGAAKFVDYADKSYGVDFTVDQAEDFRNAFFKTWEGLSDWHEDYRQIARQQGYVLSPLGRIRRLPDAQGNNSYWRGKAERAAINTPVQSMASDMMLLAASRIREVDPNIRTVALVHDAIVAEVDESYALEAGRVIKEVMESFVPEQALPRLGVRMSVPLLADVSIGRSWGEMEDLQLVA